MHKFIKKLWVLAAIVATPFGVSAQQTLESATDSLKNILKLAESGNPSAQNEVGSWYYTGTHTDQNFEKAAEWWARAAKQNDPAAISNLALCYQTGHGVSQDSVMAIKLYQNALKKGYKDALAAHIEEAKKGNLFSCMLIASCYAEGVGVKKSLSGAIPYYEVAAKAGSLDALRSLAVAYLNEKNFKDAAEWFKKGTAQGDLSSTFWYGRMLYQGMGMTVDKKEAANYFLKAADGGFPNAMYFLGNCYLNGEGLTKNAEQAVKWYRKAAGKGVAGAAWELAQCYRQGIGTPENFDEALYYYAEASVKGYNRTFNRLITDTIPDSKFVVYLKGMKAYYAKNYDAAFKDFQTLAKAKIDAGKTMEGAVYANSAFAKYDIKKGVKLLKEAAKTDEQAKYLLAGLYEAGKGVDMDMKTAVDYMTQAADADYAPALCALGDMYYEGRGVDRDYSKAVELYNKALALGRLSENSAKRLAACYEDGKGGLAADKEAAKELLDGDYKSPLPEFFKLAELK